MKRNFILAAKILFSVGILSWLFYKAQSENQFKEFFDASKDWGGLATAFACCMFAMIISFLRWNLLVQAIDLPFRFLDSLRIGFIGLFFNLSPFGVVGGDMLRAYYAAREVEHRVTDAVATVFLDRFIGLLTMVLIATIAFVSWSPDPTTLDPNVLKVLAPFKLIAVGCTISGLLFLGGLILLPNFQSRSWFQWLAEKPVIGKLIKQATQVVQMYRSRTRIVLLAFALSIVVNLCFLCSIFLLASSVLKAYPTFWNHFMIEPIAMVGNAAPLPGGIGGMEIVMDALYRVFSPLGPEEANGTVVAIGYRFFLLMINLFGGLVWLANRKQIKKLEQALPSD